MEENDLTLIQKTLQGDIESWGIMVKRYKEKVFGIALGILRNPDDAKDIVQDTFLKAYEKLDQYDLSRRFSPWLYAIAGNLCKNKLRRDRFIRSLKQPSWLISRGKFNPAERAAQERRQDLIRGSLNNLPYKYRAPLILRYYAKLSYEEISQALAIPIGTVKTRLHRAKAKLRKEMGGDHQR